MLPIIDRQTEYTSRLEAVQRKGIGHPGTPSAVRWLIGFSVRLASSGQVSRALGGLLRNSRMLWRKIAQQQLVGLPQIRGN